MKMTSMSKSIPKSLTKNKLLLLALPVIVIATVVFMLVTNTTKNEFLLRANRNRNADNQTLAYKAVLESPDNPDMSTAISGISSVSGDNMFVSMDIDTDFIELPEMKFYLVDENIYVNYQLIEEFMSFGASQYGFNFDTKEYESYVNVYDVIESMAGKEATDELKKSFEPENKALQNDVNLAIERYIKKLDNAKFTKKDGDVTLTLENKDVVGLSKTVMEALVNSKNYKGDKATIRESLRSINDVQTNEKVTLTITFGNKTGDVTISAKVEQEYNTVIATIETKPEKFIKPEKPEHVLTKDELEKALEESQNRLTQHMYESWETSDLDDESESI